MSLPQGTRDFDAVTIKKRNYIFDNIKNVFVLYGFQPLETPAMENLETLMGKYGDEGDKLIFKILNNGLENPAKQQKAKEDFLQVLEGKNIKGITERALRYDLTIPFARYVAMNQGQLTFPFKRYQVQPVWRADRPQKGRYREFWQCDADVVGSLSLLNEVDFINIYATAFRELKVDVEIRINNRKLLAALAELCGGVHKMIDITIAIDKIDKIGLEKVKEELKQRGLNEEEVYFIEKYLSVAGTNEEKLEQASALLADTETGKKGLEELGYINEFIKKNTNISNLVFDFTLARGLNYYTGSIFEVKATNVSMGSIGGGGRYDDLTGLFGVPNLPGVGISFGVDRIFDVMEELKLFPGNLEKGSDVLCFNLGKDAAEEAFKLMQHLRTAGVSCEIFHEEAKFDKQFKYAEKKHITFAIIIGANELTEGAFILKNLSTGVQQTFANSAIMEAISEIKKPS